MADIVNELSLISQNTETIKTAQYGKDVRGAMYDNFTKIKEALSKINTTQNSTEKYAIELNRTYAPTNLNDFYTDYQCLEAVIIDYNKNHEYQYENFPGTEGQYENGSFVFKRTFSYETFMSQNDYKVYCRFKKSGYGSNAEYYPWMLISEPSSVG